MVWDKASQGIASYGIGQGKSRHSIVWDKHGKSRQSMVWDKASQGIA
jgi:hypothetical protein